MTDYLNVDGVANIPQRKDIFISNATTKSANATVSYYIDTVLSSNVTLSGASSSATITVEITNNTGSTKVFNTVKYDDEAYSNSNIKFTLDGIETGTAVSGDTYSGQNTITFDVVFSFAGDDTSNPTLSSILLFEFADSADWDDGDDNGGSTGGSTGGDGSVAPGEDYMALILATLSNIKNSYGLNDPNKGSVLENAVKKDGIVYSSNKVSGGHIKHFASEERDTHNLDFMFEFSSETEYILYIWRIAEATHEDTVIGETEIAVYKQAYHKVGDEWIKSTTLAGRSVTVQTKDNNSNTILAIDYENWQVGLPEQNQ